jgi:hypothetical protein
MQLDVSLSRTKREIPMKKILILAIISFLFSCDDDEKENNLATPHPNNLIQNWSFEDETDVIWETNPPEALSSPCCASFSRVVPDGGGELSGELPPPFQANAYWSQTINLSEGKYNLTFKCYHQNQMGMMSSIVIGGFNNNNMTESFVNKKFITKDWQKIEFTFDIDIKKDDQLLVMLSAVVDTLFYPDTISLPAYRFVRFDNVELNINE